MSERSRSRRQLGLLLSVARLHQRRPFEQQAAVPDGNRTENCEQDHEIRSSGAAGLLAAAHLRWRAAQLAAAIIVCGIAGAVFASPFVPGALLPLVFALGAIQPVLWCVRRARSRAAQFAADYPTVLLAAASSLRAGLTPYQALERSTRLLPQDNPVRREVGDLLRRIDSGVPRERAVALFGHNVWLPDVALFRHAFALTLEHGGRFAPTLTRLATVSHARQTLIESAGVSTATMRMTANVLLVVAPALVLMMSQRSSGYWNVMMEHPVANGVASAGAMVVVSCYGLLRWMSDFRP